MLLLAVATALFLMAGMLGIVGGVVITKRRAQAAADLGALAGARHVAAGEPLACKHAAQIASANGATLAACSLVGLDLRITVTMSSVGPARAVTVTARARAGPQRGTSTTQ